MLQIDYTIAIQRMIRTAQINCTTTHDQESVKWNYVSHYAIIAITVWNTCIHIYNININIETEHYRIKNTDSQNPISHITIYSDCFTECAHFRVANFSHLCRLFVFRNCIAVAVSLILECLSSYHCIFVAIASSWCLQYWRTFSIPHFIIASSNNNALEMVITTI